MSRLDITGRLNWAISGAGSGGRWERREMGEEERETRSQDARS